MLGTLVVVGIILYFLYEEFVGKRKGLPPGPQPWPIIGNILQLNRNSPHMTMLKWARQYGPVFTMWTGTTPNVVICSYEGIKKYMFGKNGDILTGRPSNFLFEEVLGGRIGIIFADGQLWREQRRFTLHVLRDFGFGRTIMEDKVNGTCAALLQEMHSWVPRNEKGVAVESEWYRKSLTLAVTSLIAQLVIGRPLKASDEEYHIVQRSIHQFEDFFNNPFILLMQSVPWLRFIPGYNSLGFGPLMKHTKAFQNMISEELSRHHALFSPDDDADDFTKAFLKEWHRRQKAGESLEGFNDKQLAAIMFDLWAAGTNTMVITLRFAIFYLIHHPDVQTKVQQELDEFYGESGKEVSMSDRPLLPYTAATTMEIQRCANLVPVNLPHSPTEDINIHGYNVKKGVTVTPNMACVHVDKDVFPDPDSFKPERFLEADGKTLQKADALMPFSMGKRICAGESLARMELFVLFVGLMREFRFSCLPSRPPPSLSDPDMGIRCVTPPAFDFHLARRH